MGDFTRRDFLKWGALSAGFAALEGLGLPNRLEAVPEITDPLSYYPNRDWEKVYRDIAKVDSTFHFLCNPNDTHGCYLKAHVRNGIIVRLSPSYGYGKAEDLYGNKASPRWDPRCCQKGLVLNRRFYGDRRVKAPMIRKGFLEWTKAGYPRDPDTGLPPSQYMNRGRDSWVKVPWDEAMTLVAGTMLNVAKTYNGDTGKGLMSKQGYDPAMVEATAGAGTQLIKLRGGMPLLGITRIFGMYRFANMLGLLDSYVRQVPPEKAVGGRGWDNYSWHTDLPPGHPMVTGQQTVDFDLFDAENASFIIAWGMNWLTTKMPDAHWLSEARLKGAKVMTIACEYQATSFRADNVMIIRPGSDPALALGICNVLMLENLFDESFVKEHTDLPLLVRTDNLKLLHPSDLDNNYKLAELTNRTVILKQGETPPPPGKQGAQVIPENLRNAWGDFMIWDEKAKKPVAVSRDHVGKHFKERNLMPSLEGTFKVTLANGNVASSNGNVASSNRNVASNNRKEITVRPLFSIIKEHLMKNYDPDTVAKVCWTTKEAIVELARKIAANKEKTLLATGMGPNHFFNNDLKDRAIFLVAALTRNIGFHGGNIGSFAGNYRGAYFNGLPQFVLEDPFNIQMDPAKPAKPRKFFNAESAHYFNYGDRPLRVGNKLFTGKTHMPVPSKVVWVANSNSLIGNIKWHYDVVVNTLPKVEMLVVNEWWWTLSCEWADVVLPVDSWAELRYPDITASVTNPFLMTLPRTPLPRIFETRSDLEIMAGVAEKLSELTGDKRFGDHWKFISDGKAEVYLQRILNVSTPTKGYKIEKLEEKAKEGIPSLMLCRTYPITKGWEQTHESVPWYTKTGRLEFYREEDTFIEHGENLPVHREPVDGTPYEPNVIMGQTSNFIRPTPPEKYGINPSDLSTETRQVRNVLKSGSQIIETNHPMGKGLVFITPKYRWGAHTTAIDTDYITAFFGPFGDFYRRDKRTPSVGESYMDINPFDAKELGLNDGDYAYIIADPEDRPFRGHNPKDKESRFARLMARVRFYPGIPRGVARMWFNMYQASPLTVKAHEERPDNLAKNPETNYQSMFRYGGHQSCVRAWLRPTLMTDTLSRKNYFGQQIGTGFEPDIHCPVGAPKESYVHVKKAEDGGTDGKPIWRPALLGLRPGYESLKMHKFINGQFVKVVK